MGPEYVIGKTEGATDYLEVIDCAAVREYVNNNVTPPKYDGQFFTLLDFVIEKALKPEPIPEHTLLYLTNGEVVELDITEITSGITDEYGDTLSRCVLGSNCTSIGDDAFNKKEGLIEVKMHSGVTYIGENAFTFSSMLGGTYTPSRTFDGTFTVPTENLTYIGENAFCGVFVVNIEKAKPDVFNKKMFGGSAIGISGTLRYIIALKNIDESVDPDDYETMFRLLAACGIEGTEKCTLEYFIVTDLIPEIDYSFEYTILHTRTVQSMVQLIDKDGDGKMSAEEIMKFVLENAGTWDDPVYLDFTVYDEWGGTQYISIEEYRTFSEAGYTVYIQNYCELGESVEDYNVSNRTASEVSESSLYSYCVDSNHNHHEGEMAAVSDSSSEYGYYMYTSNPYDHEEPISDSDRIASGYWQIGYNAQWLIEHPNTRIEYWEGYHAGITDYSEGSSQNPYISDIEKYGWWNDGYQAGWELNPNNTPEPEWPEEPSMISFTVDGELYEANEGDLWENWVDPETNGFSTGNSGNVINYDMNIVHDSSGNEVGLGDEIINGESYSCWVD